MEKNKERNKIVFYIGHINYIGGVEDWMYYIAKMYHKTHDIELYYGWSAPEQLRRLEPYIKATKYNGQNIECETVILSYDMSIIDNIKAKDYILTIHADYDTQNLRITIPKQITKIYGVSDIATEAFKRTHKAQLDRLGLEIKTLYNPIMIDEPKKVLKLISTTRLTKEKGRARMKEIATVLNSCGIPFIWLVFTNDPDTIKIDNFIYMKPRLDIDGFVQEADYLVQVSDTEGFAYSIVKSLVLGTPVIVTDFPVTKEMGIVDGENGYILKMDLSNLDANKIYNNIPKVKDYVKKESPNLWLNEVLGKPTKSDYKWTKPKGIMVEVLIPTFYSNENKDCKVGDVLYIENENRLKELLGDNILRKQFVRVL